MKKEILLIITILFIIIKTLMDEVEIKSCDKCGTIIKMTKLVGVEE